MSGSAINFHCKNGESGIFVEEMTDMVTEKANLATPLGSKISDDVERTVQ